MCEQQPAKLETPSQEAPPAQAHAKRFGSQKVFLPEAGIFADGDRLGLQSRSGPKAEGVAAHGNGASKRSRQPVRQLLLEPGMANYKGNTVVGQPQNCD